VEDGREDEEVGHGAIEVGRWRSELGHGSRQVGRGDRGFAELVVRMKKSGMEPSKLVVGRMNSDMVLAKSGVGTAD